ncbi:MAG: type II secretion system minor pseudopilin GspH [Proteobacteria bacterium]|nr:type II secretion system minor pseudopilin GspH [Pseudomonadota bacterium]
MKSRQSIRYQCSIKAARYSGGFSLIEIMVVVTIIAVIAGMAVLSIGEDPRRSVQDEAQRLHALLTQAKEEAILQGQLYVLRMEEDRYEFMQPDEKGKLQALSDELFRPRQFGGNVTVDASEVDGRDTGKEPSVVIYPTGDISPFRIVLANSGGRWQVIGLNDGELLAGLVEDEI